VLSLRRKSFGIGYINTTATKQAKQMGNYNPLAAFTHGTPDQRAFMFAARFFGASVDSIVEYMVSAEEWEDAEVYADFELAGRLTDFADFEAGLTWQ
jgi:hypothetical protein